MTTPASPEPEIPDDRRDDAVAVVRRLREAGHVAYFAGGCVRDMLLGLRPKDYDVATDAPPDRVRRLFSNTQAVGAAFGVILVRQRRSQIEVATFRTDGAYADGRRPDSVVFTTAEEDAKRRDFTINGMFFDPVEAKVIDYVGGQADLKNKLLRAIGDADQRFEEDHLRLLRAVRFAARFSLMIEPTTAEAIRTHADQLKRISPERISEELRTMLTPPTREAAWRMLWDFALVQEILRHLPEKPVWFWSGHGTAPVFPFLAPDRVVPYGLSLAALTYCYRSSGSPELESRSLLAPAEVRRTVLACRTALKISNHEEAVLTESLALEPLLRDDPPTIAALKRFLAKPFSSEARDMLRALSRSGRVSSRAIWLEAQFTELERTDFAPPPLLTGDDLTAAGWTPGPLFKRVLDAVYDAQLEDRVETKPEALAMADRMRGEKPS